ncbi:hypothetical protein GCM10008982_26950 [Anoxybacillus voinovskiensis]|nr:hypothetical protein GCM10008982_26950 [Anoxybacillus voinovskiensis]
MDIEQRLAELEARIAKLEKEAADKATAPKSVSIQPHVRIDPSADLQKICRELHHRIKESNRACTEY